MNIVPRNPIRAAAETDMLGVIFFGLMFGAALTVIPADKAKPMIDVLEALNAVVTAIIHFAMLLAPFGVAALIFTVSSRFGFDLMIAIAAFVVTVLLALHRARRRDAVGDHPVPDRHVAAAVLLAGPRRADHRLLDQLVERDAADGDGRRHTSNSACRSGSPGSSCRIGSTMCMNGTAIFEGITVIFLAEIFGVDLSLGQMAAVMIMSVITAVGAAGVPGGSIPLLVGVLTMFGVPGEGIAIVLGVDRILDMSRTTVNVCGDLTAATWVARSEGMWTPDQVPSRRPAGRGGQAVDADVSVIRGVCRIERRPRRLGLDVGLDDGADPVGEGAHLADVRFGCGHGRNGLVNRELDLARARHQAALPHHMTAAGD